MKVNKRKRCREDISSKSVQPKPTTFREVMHNLDVSAFLNNTKCTLVSTVPGSQLY